jgi:hypothetical protein
MRVEAALEELERNLGLVEEELSRTRDHLASEQRLVHQLLRLLLEYGRHNAGCNGQWGEGYRCRCGWREHHPTVLRLWEERRLAGERT